MRQRFLLDTTVLIDLSKGSLNARARLDGLLSGGGVAGVCAVAVAEFLTGAPLQRRARMGRVIDEFAYWETMREAAEAAGELRHDLARRGITLHVPDALIAGLARTLDAVLLTYNVKDFVHTGIRVQGFGN